MNDNLENQNNTNLEQNIEVSSQTIQQVYSQSTTQNENVENKPDFLGDFIKRRVLTRIGYSCVTVGFFWGFLVFFTQSFLYRIIFIILSLLFFFIAIKLFVRAFKIREQNYQDYNKTEVGHKALKEREKFQWIIFILILIVLIITCITSF